MRPRPRETVGQSAGWARARGQWAGDRLFGKGGAHGCSAPAASFSFPSSPCSPSGSHGARCRLRRNRPDGDGRGGPARARPRGRAGASDHRL